MKVILSSIFCGVLIAFVAVVAEQFLAIVVNIFSGREIVLDVYTHLSFFLVASAVIEESFKYFVAVFVLRRFLNLEHFKFILAALLAGLFFGATEIYLILLTNGKRVQDIQNLDGNTVFSLAAIALLHIFTFFFISSFIASRQKETRFQAINVLPLPIFIHLLFNFLVIQKGDFTNWLIGIVLGIFFAINLFLIVFSFRKLAR